ncbi:response regulator [Cohnella pontilimi]|uniref:Response regulator n=1 Tax=Cohnella pontilimi TaxID=2564100 RepID=A0A4U0F9I1_9BACL|nr:response regulator [Cohnella pontilimi]TJY41158.1 response regulator [Cohnella pontilimi]
MARLIIVDDAALMRMMLKQIVLDMGHEVVGEAENGEEAVQRYMSWKPDLIIMDITMPVMDGLTALKAIIEFNHRAKVIICSALGRKNVVAEAFQAGAKEFLVKPYERERVMDSISKVIQM